MSEQGGRELVERAARALAGATPDEYEKYPAEAKAALEADVTGVLQALGLLPEQEQADA